MICEVNIALGTMSAKVHGLFLTEQDSCNFMYSFLSLKVIISGHQKDEGRCFSDPQVNYKRLGCFYGLCLYAASSEACSHPSCRVQQAALGAHAFCGAAGLQFNA